jgi:hypothetical protein
MNIIKKVILLTVYTISMTNIGYASNFDIEFSNLAIAKVENAMPQIFIFDKEGKLIHHSQKYYPGLIRSFDNKREVNDAAILTENLFNLLKTQPKFKENDYTLYYFTIAQSVGPCVPCRNQESILEIIKKKLNNKSISYNTVSIF